MTVATTVPLTWLAFWNCDARELREFAVRAVNFAHWLTALTSQQSVAEGFLVRVAAGV